MYTSGIITGVNHGETGGTSPQNLEWGTLMQIVPPYFVMFQTFKHQIAWSTMRGDGTDKNTADLSRQAKNSIFYTD